MSAISVWLASIGLEQYTPLFVANDIDCDVLGELTDQDLVNLGLSLGHRRKFLMAARHLNAAAGERRSMETPPAGEGEWRQLTVVFVDLVGSSAMSTRRDAEEMRSIVSDYQACVSACTTRFDGYLAKFMGDGALLYFGYPQAHENDAERAVMMALELVRAVEELPSVEALQARVGIATGLVVVGDLVGSGEARERAVFGETPNLAARLQAAGGPGHVVLSAATKALVADRFEFEDLGPIDAKGFAGPVQAFRAEPLRGTGNVPMQRPKRRLVGRSQPLAVLDLAWEAVAAGAGRGVHVRGEAGIGKSRLADALQERVAASKGAFVHYACSSLHQDTPLFPVLDHVDREICMMPSSSDRERLTALARIVSAGTASPSARLAADLLRIQEGPSQDHARAFRPRSIRILVEEVGWLQRQSPALVVIEDVHWIDPTTGEALEALIRELPSLNALVLTTARSEFAASWTAAPHVQVIDLQKLDRCGAQSMILEIAGGRHLPDPVVDQIVARTDGVPLFIEEVTKDVLERNLQELGTGQDGSAAIPASLHASLLARLDRHGAMREIAQAGSVLGRSFAGDLVGEMAGIPEHRVREGLMHLLLSGLATRAEGTGAAEYTFRHALIHDAAYSTLLRSRRQKLHERAADVLDRRFPGLRSSAPELLAHHKAAAGRSLDAVELWSEAARRSVQRSAMKEAISQIGKALALVPNLSENSGQAYELDLRISLGQALLAARGYAAPEVQETLARSTELARKLGRHERLYGLAYREWTFLLVRGELEAAMEHSVRLEKIATEERSPGYILLSLSTRGVTNLFMGRFMAARDLFEQCYGLEDRRAEYVDVVAEDPYCVMLGYLGLTYVYLGQVTRGRELMARGIAACRTLGHAHTTAFVLNWAAQLETVIGSREAVASYAEEVIAISSEHGFPVWLANGKISRSWAMADADLGSYGFQEMTDGLAMLRGTGAALGAPWMLARLSEALLRLGQHEPALQRLNEACELAAKGRQWKDLSEIYRITGQVMLSLGKLSEARESFVRAADIAAEQGAALFASRANAAIEHLRASIGP